MKPYGLVSMKYAVDSHGLFDAMHPKAFAESPVLSLAPPQWGGSVTCTRLVINLATVFIWNESFTDYKIQNLELTNK